MLPSVADAAPLSARAGGAQVPVVAVEENERKQEHQHLFVPQPPLSSSSAQSSAGDASAQVPVVVAEENERKPQPLFVPQPPLSSSASPLSPGSSSASRRPLSSCSASAVAVSASGPPPPTLQLDEEQVAATTSVGVLPSISSLLSSSRLNGASDPTRSLAAAATSDEGEHEEKHGLVSSMFAQFGFGGGGSSSRAQSTAERSSQEKAERSQRRISERSTKERSVQRKQAKSGEVEEGREAAGVTGTYKPHTPLANKYNSVPGEEQGGGNEGNEASEPTSPSPTIT